MPLIPAWYTDQLNRQAQALAMRPVVPPQRSLVTGPPMNIGNSRPMAKSSPLFGAYAPRRVREVEPPVNTTMPVPTPTAPIPAPVDTSAYNELMEHFRNLLSRQPTITNIPPPATYTPTDQNYIEDPEYKASLERIKNLAETGGLSAEEQAAMRARGISPIRAAYANAEREINRNRAVQGGYSPSFGALTAKMAREMGDKLSEGTTNVNAAIAEMVQKGKLQSAPQLAEAMARRDAIRNEIEGRNVAARNRAEEFNRQIMEDYAKRKLQADLATQEFPLRTLEGMTRLYGTTPALTKLFTDQVMNQNELSQRGGLGLIDAYLRARGGR